MQMLLLDAGNSRIKWALVQYGARMQHGSAPLGDISALGLEFAGLASAGLAPRRIVASNVAGEAVAEQIRSACAAWQCRVEFIAARAEQCGVRNGYERPEQLGSDRWAALIAAWHQAKTACVVVNCGTATTLDALSAAGEFPGGLILPGLDMMRRSLAAGTAQLEAATGNWRDFPRNTGDAIYSGTIKATVGAIREQHALLGAPGAPCVLSGGAASLIQPHLGLPVLRVDDLVLQGLQLIGQKTE